MPQDKDIRAERKGPVISKVYCLMKNLIKALDKECTIVFPDITTLGTDPDEASSIYEGFPDKGIRMESTDSPWLDTCSMRLLFKVNPQEAKRFAPNNLVSALNWKKNRAVTAKEADTSISQASDHAYKAAPLIEPNH